MRYLSFDIEATGLRENDYVIEFGMVPFDTDKLKIEKELSFHCFVQCPRFEELEPNLDPWVIEHNKDLIKKAAKEGLPLDKFKEELNQYFNSPQVQSYFSFPENKIVLFGKSMNAIDLPFLNRDLGWEYMRHYFSHQQLDLSSLIYGFIDQGLLPSKCTSGSALMEYMEMGEVSHTALEDAYNTALIYLKLLERLKKSS